ncbi:MAG: N-methyl-transferase [Candidatus Peregrinibacteria bacterium Greene0416_19]|nr:MAG: N-methyl-transferase [Candidatus Peregrinibacteria bacterium Greene0416_19]
MPTSENQPIALAPDRKEELLRQVNDTLAGMQSTMKYKRLIDPIPGCEALRGKRIVMVDDNSGVLQNFVEHLTVVTDGSVSFIRHGDQELENLIREIMSTHPDIVLMDYHLSETLKGDAVVRALLERQPGAMCIGFSSDNNAREPFVRAGAKGVARKEAYDAEASLRAVAEIVSST